MSSEVASDGGSLKTLSEEEKPDVKWFEKVYKEGLDLPGCICLVGPVDSGDQWRIYNNTSTVHTEFYFTNDREMTRLLRDRAVKAQKTGVDFKVLIYLTRLCGCRKKCLCHRHLREWLSEFVSLVNFRFIFGSMVSLNRGSMLTKSQIWFSHLESLMNLLHFAVLHSKLMIESASKESFNEFIKASELDESLGGYPRVLRVQEYKAKIIKSTEYMGQNIRSTSTRVHGTNPN